MTTLVQDVYSALAALAPAGGVHIAINEAEPPVFPFIVFLRVVSTANVSLGGPSGLQSTRIQVDVFDRQYSNCAALASRVQTALLGAFATYPNACLPLTSADSYEAPVKAHRVSADYSIWYFEAPSSGAGSAWLDALIWNDTSVWDDGSEAVAYWDDSLAWNDAPTLDDGSGAPLPAWTDAEVWDDTLILMD